MNKILLVIGMLFSLCATGSEQYDGIPDKFMGLVEKGDHISAVDLIFGGAKGPEKIDAETKFVKEQLLGVLGNFGKYYFHEKISEENIGSRYARLTYIIGYKEKPLFISFVLYKNEKTWRVRSYTTNSNYKALVKSNNETL